MNDMSEVNINAEFVPRYTAARKRLDTMVTGVDAYNFPKDFPRSRR
ncbi:hypothetical protein [Polyangium sp. y55x31]|nr:hypothetical protein [Polyangium sp. y55x31]MDI1483629.1 hypothetical protein [Polyangium sp. y55x31]